MDDVKQMFQKIVNGQSAMKSELITKIDGVHKEVQKRELQKWSKKSLLRFNSWLLCVRRAYFLLANLTEFFYLVRPLRLPQPFFGTRRRGKLFPWLQYWSFQPWLA